MIEEKDNQGLQDLPDNSPMMGSAAPMPPRLPSPPRLPPEPNYSSEPQIPDEYIVKVFVINEDGNWSDCGVGKLIFLTHKDVVVCAEKHDQKDRDVISANRAEKLRGGGGKSSTEVIGEDRGELLLKVDLTMTEEFVKTQSKFLGF